MNPILAVISPKVPGVSPGAGDARPAAAALGTPAAEAARSFADTLAAVGAAIDGEGADVGEPSIDLTQVAPGFSFVAPQDAVPPGLAPGGAATPSDDHPQAVPGQNGSGPADHATPVAGGLADGPAARVGADGIAPGLPIAAARAAEPAQRPVVPFHASQPSQVSSGDAEPLPPPIKWSANVGVPTEGASESAPPEERGALSAHDQKDDARARHASSGAEVSTSRIPTPRANAAAVTDGTQPVGVDAGDSMAGGRSDVEAPGSRASIVDALPRERSATVRDPDGRPTAQSSSAAMSAGQFAGSSDSADSASTRDFQQDPRAPQAREDAASVRTDQSVTVLEAAPLAGPEVGRGPAVQHHAATPFGLQVASAILTNVASPAATPPGFGLGPSSESLPDQTATQIVQAMRLQFLQGGGGQARIRLEPHHFGELTVAIRVDQGQVVARLEAETPAVRDWLQTNQSWLRSSLAEQNLTLDRFEVTESRESRSESRRGNEQQQTPDREAHPRARRHRPDTGELFEVVA